MGAIIGSVARGTASPDSDLDVLVLIESPQFHADVLDALLAQGDDLNASYGSRVSPVVLTTDQWNRMRLQGDHFTVSATAEASVFLGSFSAVPDE